MGVNGLTASRCVVWTIFLLCRNAQYEAAQIRIFSKLAELRHESLCGKVWTQSTESTRRDKVDGQNVGEGMQRKVLIFASLLCCAMCDASSVLAQFALRK